MCHKEWYSGIKGQGVWSFPVSTLQILILSMQLISWQVANGQVWPSLIGGVAEFLCATQLTDSLCEDTVGLPITRYFFEVASVVNGSLDPRPLKWPSTHCLCMHQSVPQNIGRPDSYHYSQLFDMAHQMHFHYKNGSFLESPLGIYTLDRTSSFADKRMAPQTRAEPCMSSI